MDEKLSLGMFQRGQSKQGCGDYKGAEGQTFTACAGGGYSTFMMFKLSLKNFSNNKTKNNRKNKLIYQQIQPQRNPIRFFEYSLPRSPSSQKREKAEKSLLVFCSFARGECFGVLEKGCGCFQEIVDREGRKITDCLGVGEGVNKRAEELEMRKENEEVLGLDWFSHFLLNAGGSGLFEVCVDFGFYGRAICFYKGDGDCVA